MGHSTNGWFLHSASLLFPGSRYEFSSSLRENRVKIRASKHVQQVVSKLYNDAVHRFNMHSEMTRRLQMRFSANCLHEHQFAKIPEAFRALFVKWVPRSALCTSRPSLMPDVLRIEHMKLSGEIVYWALFGCRCTQPLRWVRASVVMYLPLVAAPPSCTPLW
jgi:hypothetical protein